MSAPITLARLTAADLGKTLTTATEQPDTLAYVGHGPDGTTIRYTNHGWRKYPTGTTGTITGTKENA